MQPHPKPGADHFERVQSTRIWNDIMRGFVGLLPVAGKDNARALDVGCGPGLLCRLLAERGWQATGVDNHPDMITRAGELAGDFPAGQEPRFACAALEDLPFQAGDFDLACSANLLFFLADPAAGLTALRRVCRPGGVVATLNPCPELSVERAHDIAVARALPELDTQVLINWAMLGELNGVEFDRTFGENAVCSAFETAGLRDVKWYETPEPGIGGVAIGYVEQP